MSGELPRRQARVPEAFVAWLWESRALGSRFSATDGRAIQVIYPGRRIGSWGPDYRGALLAVGPSLQHGDVEIHVSSADWARHRHGADPAYAATILHVVLFDTGAGSDTAPTLTLELGPLAHGHWEPLLARWQASSAIPPSPACLDPGAAGQLLDRAGLARFEAKAARFQADMTVVSPQQALWTGLLECLGYARNQDAFRHLSQRLPVLEARGLARDDPEVLEAAVFGEAGLLPCQRGLPPADPRAQRLEEHWVQLGRRGPAGGGTAWHLAGSRPANRPPRRLAAAAQMAMGGLLDPAPAAILMPLSELPPGQAGRRLVQALIIPGDDYWRGHQDFGRRLANPCALVGSARAAESVVNVVLPWAAAVSRRRDDAALERAAFNAFAVLPALGGNQLTRHMARQILGEGSRATVTTALRQQGLVHIYRGWCDERDCGSCPAGHEASAAPPAATPAREA